MAAPIAFGFHAAANVDHRRRLGGAAYTLVDLRVSYALRRASVFLDATNLFDEDYIEISRVAMPGRWITFGMTLR